MVAKPRQAGTGQDVQSSRVAVTVGQPVWTAAEDAEGTALVRVMAVLPPSGEVDWARMGGRLLLGWR